MKPWNTILLAAVIGLLVAGCDNSSTTKGNAEPLQNGSANQATTHDAKDSAEENHDNMDDQPQETEGANDPAGKSVGP
ncbi:hypothetical protein Z042_04665 [Chania multitudinisentens RB-25]|uniref:Lipoprotein n=1 Tax=Chania multitudinisentens RB-25 TaxID=1441930 RepID=W0LJZ7_9GAMM|nr:hypothetical protein [Chania multitudinisentens]AHG22657.1 hypothetical protein Z042_04665 [Chania multitudinisentens RB-25]